jgi:D-alanine-D-alanine ligase
VFTWRRKCGWFMVKVGVFMGGTSAEREVSLVTGGSILEALLGQGVDALPVDTAGEWQEVVARQGIDRVFLALHGRGGEDGTIQGALDLMGIPYTGSGVMASALAMDKMMTKKVLKACGIPTPEFIELGPVTHHPPAGLDFPVVVKPNREGSTIGITVVNEEQQLAPAIERAAVHDPLVMIEEFINGDDLTVGILNGAPLAVVQIVTETGFYDYKTKYVTGAKEYRCPAPLGERTTSLIQDLALASAKALRCCGGVRVDLRGEGDRFSVIEINTMPGMTPTSLLPKSAAATGMDFGELVLEMLRTAGEGSR